MSSSDARHMPRGQRPIRVLIADDHPIVRAGIRRELEKCDDQMVVGEAPDGVTAVEQVWELQPDVLLLDIHMPIMSGIVVMGTIIHRPANRRRPPAARARAFNLPRPYLRLQLVCGWCQWVSAQK